MERLILLSHILERFGSIRGDKSFQKLIFLIQSSEQYLSYRYTWNGFGPVSIRLEQDIQEAVSLGILSKGWEDSLPVYSPGSDIKSTYIRSKLANTTLPKPVDFRLTKILKIMNEETLESKKLEILASLDYLRQNNKCNLEEAKKNLIGQTNRFTTREIDNLGGKLLQLQ